MDIMTQEDVQTFVAAQEKAMDDTVTLNEIHHNFWVACVDFGWSLSQILIHLLTSICGTQTKVRNYSMKERADISGCYKGFYWFEFVGLMAWLCTAWSFSISWFSAMSEYQEIIDDASLLASKYANCSDDLFNYAVDRVTYKDAEKK